MSDKPLNKKISWTEICSDANIENYTRIGSAMLPILVISNLSQFSNPPFFWISAFILVISIIFFLCRCYAIIIRGNKTATLSPYTPLINSLTSFPYALILISLLAPNNSMWVGIGISIFLMISDTLRFLKKYKTAIHPTDIPD